MAYRDRVRRKARGAPARDPKPLVLIVCGGAVTEPEYFEGLKRATRNPRVEIRIVAVGRDPKQVVQEAVRHKRERDLEARRESDENLTYDRVWCVFDTDEFDLQQATRVARQNQIELAVSNPCFELWLYLHFRDSPGPRTTGQMTKLLRGLLPPKQRGKRVDFAHYEPFVPQAKDRARRLDKQARLAGEPGRNPTTGVHAVVATVTDR